MLIACHRLQRNVAIAVVVVGCATLAADAVARAADRIGVVLMHGEQGAPGRVIDSLARVLESAGYLVGRPDMCWSARRAYEAPFAECLAAIDDAIVKLKNLGATSIVVGGFSLGGNAAIAYGASHSGLLGIVGVAPAHDALATLESTDIADSVAKARELADSGRGDEVASFADVAIGPSGAYATEIATTPTIYLSFFGPASAANIPDNTRRLTAPLLWIAGAEDPTQRGGPNYAFAFAPSNSLNRYITVTSAHLTTSDAAKQAVLAWLKEVAAK
jgi:esterase/lipase